MMGLKKTVNIHGGNKLSGKSWEDLVEAIRKLFGGQGIIALQ